MDMSTPIHGQKSSTCWSSTLRQRRRRRWIIIGSDRRPETKQEIERKIDYPEILIVSDWAGLGLAIIDRWSEPDRRSEPINFGAC